MKEPRLRLYLAAELVENRARDEADGTEEFESFRPGGLGLERGEHRRKVREGPDAFETLDEIDVVPYELVSDGVAPHQRGDDQDKGVRRPSPREEAIEVMHV